MSGLYNRALEFVRTQRRFRIVKPDEFEDDDVQDVSPEEREKILEQINEIVEQNRIQIEPDTFDFRPKKRGGVLPAIINISAILLMAGGGYLALRYFNQRQDTLVIQRSTLQSAEGKLLEALKQESEELLSEKEQAINEIQGRLSEMSQERQRLAEEAQDQMRTRETELRLAMEQALIEERSKLRDQGISEDEITSRLSDLEQQKEIEFNLELESVRQAAQAEIEEREATLNQLMGEYEQALVSAESDRELLETQLTRQEVELLAQFEEKEAELESERIAALQELDSIRSQQEHEVLVLDQILSFYGSVRAYLADEDFLAANAGLQELKAYLNQADVAVLPAVSRRRQVELFLISSLEGLMEREQEAVSPDTLSLIQSADMVAAASALVERGNRSYINGDFAAAQELYLSALEKIPAVKLGFGRLQAIAEGVRNQQNAFVSGIVDDANRSYLNGDFERAVELYGDAIELIPAVSATSDQVIAQLTDAGFRINRQGDLEAIQRLQEIVTRQDSDLTRLAALELELESTRTRAEEAELRLERIPELEADIEALRAEAEIASRELEKIPVLEGELETMRAAAERTARELEQIPVLETELAAMEAAAAQAARELERLTTLEEELESMQSAAEQTARELERIPVLTAEIETLQTTLAKNAVDLDRIPDLESQITSVQGKLGDAEAELVRMTEVESELETLRGKAAEMEVELQSIAKLESEIAAIKKDAAVSAEELERIPRLEDEIHRLTVEAKQDAEKLLSMKDLQVEIERLRGVETELREQATSLTSEVERLKPMEESYLEREQLISELAELRERYIGRVGTDEIAEDDESIKALALLETKLLIKRVMVSDSVRSQYPNLYDQTELYLEELVANQQVETRIETLKDLNSLLDGVLSDQVISPDLLLPFEEVTGRDDFLGLIERLKTLLQ